MRHMIWSIILTLIPVVFMPPVPQQPPDEEAPAGGQQGGSNGFSTDEQFAGDQEQFEEPATLDTGLGPAFNNDSCVSCHHHPLSGGGSMFTELRTNRGLVHARSLPGTPTERVRSADEPTGLRVSPSLFGLGFVECVGDDDLRAVVADQPFAMRGELTVVPVLEAPGKTRVGRFGLKSQQASLLSFAGDAEFNEKGVTNRLVPGTTPFEDKEGDIDKYARFMRSLPVPTPDGALVGSVEAAEGEELFTSLGCAVCHYPLYGTAPVGTKINGGVFVVPPALGGKAIRPFSDFALHDVGTGDGVQGNKFRTATLWGGRFKNRFMHDGQTFTRHSAIVRHKGEAEPVSKAYQQLPKGKQERLLTFLRSL